VIPVCYAYIKNGTVIDVAVFNDPSDELLTHFIKEFDLDYLIDKYPDFIKEEQTYLKKLEKGN
jgi:hypothetical protein